MTARHRPSRDRHKDRERNDRKLRHKDRARLVTDVGLNRAQAGPVGTSARTEANVKDGRRWFRGALVRVPS